MRGREIRQKNVSPASTLICFQILLCTSTHPAHTTQLTLRDLAHTHEGWCPWALSPADIARRGPRLFFFSFFFVLSLHQEDFSFFFLAFFGTPLFQKGGGVGWGRATTRQGKRDKYSYEVECVTDVPIGCILNR
jgi:hypothetical protein